MLSLVQRSPLQRHPLTGRTIRRRSSNGEPEEMWFIPFLATIYNT
jgi:hypothetical protein